MSLRIYSFEMTYVNYWKFNLCLDLSLRPITALLQQNFRSRQRETAHQEEDLHIGAIFRERNQ